LKVKSKDYINIKRMAFSEPTMLHHLRKLADAIALYVRYQIDAGAQVVQMFDLAGQPVLKTSRHLPWLYRRVVEQVKATHPDTPLTFILTAVLVC